MTKLNKICILLSAIVIAIGIIYLINANQTETSINKSSQPAHQENPVNQADNEPVPKTIYANSDNLLVEEVVSNLSVPWDIIFTPDDVMIVNQRSGSLIAKFSNGDIKNIQADFSDLDVRAELGLMGMEIDPNFINNRRFYTCQGDINTKQVKVVAWRINTDYSQAIRVDDPLLAGIPSANIHVGCRLRFGAEGYLWISTGDAAQGVNPQNLNSLSGKILRIDASSGQPVDGNPFSSSQQAKYIYSFGHRNPQGLAWNFETQEMWSVEHGPDIDDEINLLKPGGNYGWNPVSEFSHYDQNVAMTDVDKYPKAIEAKWSSGKPTIAVSGAIFLQGEHWGDKQNWLAVATLKNRQLYLFKFNQTGNFLTYLIVPELDETYGRLRTPIIGNDQALYITTSNGNGNDFVLRVIPASD